jgi:CHAT domain-containing protein/tetratricopeptide (TPR) repeat protein
VAWGTPQSYFPGLRVDLTFVAASAGVHLKFDYSNVSTFGEISGSVRLILAMRARSPIGGPRSSKLRDSWYPSTEPKLSRRIFSDRESLTSRQRLGGALRHFSRWLLLGAGVAGLLVFSLSGGLSGLLAGNDRAYSRDYRRLLDSLGPTRPIEARVSGGDRYRPYRSPSRPRPSNAVKPSSTLRGETALEEEMPSRLPVSPEIVRAISKADGREPSPENRAALAVLSLFDGRLKQAIQMLRKACEQKPDDPRILNDLAAALLKQSEATGDPWPALEAIEMAERSIQLQPSLPALFNKALALGRWEIRVRAITAWKQYLDQDNRSAWAEEAAQRLGRLEQELAEDQARPQLLARPAEDVRDFPENPWANRQFGERVLLTRWAELTLAGRTTDADETLAQAEALAGTLNPSAGGLLSASISAIYATEQSGDRARLDLLARGHETFGRAFLRWREERAVESRALVADAIRNLHAVHSPFELRARVLRAWMAAEPDWEEIRRIGEEAEAAGFRSVVAEVRRIAAYRMTLEGRLEAAIDVYRDAQQHFAVLNEREAASVISIMRTELLTDLGRNRESSEELAAALAAGPRLADPWDRYSIYVVAAAATSSRFSRAALELRLEAAEACRDLSERPLCSVDSWLRVAAITPDADVAEVALQRASEILPRVPESDGSKRTEIDLTVARARWLASPQQAMSDREEALELYREAAARYDGRRLAVSAALARAERARLLQQLGRPEEAVAEYRAGLRTFRLWDQSDRFRPERAEKRSPAALRGVYESLLNAELDSAGESPSSAAFLLSEEMHDRLAPRLTPEFWLPNLATLPRFIAAAPPGTAIVEYAIFDDRAVAWILAGGRLDQVKLTVPDRLGERIRSLALERNLEAWKSSSAVLYQALLAPVLAHLSHNIERLVLIPDSHLYGIPFRALWNPKAGRYVDEDLVVSLAPSVRQLLGKDGSQPVVEREAAGGQLSMLSIGFSAFAPGLHLARLSRAGDEAASVLNAYGVRSSICPVTDWSGFRRCAPKADILHLATHAAASTEDLESWLAFPREIVSIERLWRELPDLPLRPVVVLSACQSVATARGGEGLGGLARPFLARGTRAVVGTLWKLPDSDAAILFPSFHQAYRVSGEPAVALRQARQALARWREVPWVWGGIIVVG